MRNTPIKKIFGYFVVNGKRVSKKGTLKTVAHKIHNINSLKRNSKNIK